MEEAIQQEKALTYLKRDTHGGTHQVIQRTRIGIGVKIHKTGKGIICINQS